MLVCLHSSKTKADYGPGPELWAGRESDATFRLVVTQPGSRTQPIRWRKFFNWGVIVYACAWPSDLWVPVKNYLLFGRSRLFTMIYFSHQLQIWRTDRSVATAAECRSFQSKVQQFAPTLRMTLAVSGRMDWLSQRCQKEAAFRSVLIMSCLVGDDKALFQCFHL